MNAFKHAVMAVAVGLTVLAAPGSASAQELPTGAARIVEKVQTRIFISKSSLTFRVAAILENLPSPGE